MTMPLAALLFDMDGTLVDSERESAEAMARALASGRGIHITTEDREFIIGRSWVDIHASLATRYPTLEWTMDQLIAATAARREEVFAEQGVHILPGAREAIDRFAHLPRAIVTGSSRVEARQSLVALGRESAFQFVFAAEDVHTSKPDPAGYLAAARALGVAPGDCLVIEDSSAGIRAGVAAGARVVAVRAGNFLGQDQSMAHLVLDTLDELTVERASTLFV